MNPRGPLVAALLALGAAGLGCGPDRVRVVDSRGRLASVTLPESLVAGQLVPVYVDIGYLNCFETFRGFYVTRILGSEIWVEPMVRREITGAVCPAVIGPRAIFTYPARVPPAGPSIVHFVGLGDSIAVSLVPGPMPPGPEHRVVLLPKFGAVRVDSVAVSWFHGPATVASNDHDRSRVDYRAGR